MLNWKLKLGNFLFKHRSFTPIPLIILVFILFRPVDLGERNILVNVVGLLVSVFGEVIRVISVGYAYTGTSGRESYLKADALNTTGIYSIVRNPLYIGNFFMFTGLVVVYANIFAVLVFVVFTILQYYFIILSEEEFLRKKYGSDYETYCCRVRRVIPTFRDYKRNQNSFNLKKVIFKENDSVFNMLVLYLLVMLYKEGVFAGSISGTYFYAATGAALLIGYAVIKILKKRG